VIEIGHRNQIGSEPEVDPQGGEEHPGKHRLVACRAQNHENREHEATAQDRENSPIHIPSGLPTRGRAG